MLRSVFVVAHLAACASVNDTESAPTPVDSFVEAYCHAEGEPTLACYCDGPCGPFYWAEDVCSPFDAENAPSSPAYLVGEYVVQEIPDELHPVYYLWSDDGSEGVAVYIVNDEYTYQFCGSGPAPVVWFTADQSVPTGVLSETPDCEVTDLDTAVPPC